MLVSCKYVLLDGWRSRSFRHSVLSQGVIEDVLTVQNTEARIVVLQKMCKEMEARNVVKEVNKML